MKKNFSELSLLLRFPYSCDNDNCCLVDVGAHVGGFSQEFGRKNWQVIAFEPEPSNYQALCVNIAQFPKIKCVNKAVSDVAAQEVSLYISDDNHAIHALKPFHKTHQSVLTVETVRLDETLDELNVGHVTLLKTDIEGADFLALKGFDFDRYHPEVVMCEFMDDRSQANYSYTHHDVVSYMRQWGYVCYVSEWAPITEYVREGNTGNEHTFIQCVPYPLDHNPAWGNLIFVPQNRTTQFEQTLNKYMRFNALASIVKLVPGTTRLYQKLRRLKTVG